MTQASSLEQVWRYREETVYPRLFGPQSRGTFVLTIELFQNIFSQESIDPRWLHYGVIEHGPTPERDTWIYITTAASNPWELDPSEYSSSEYSGFGTELVLETIEQADWAIVILQRLLAFNILLGHSRYGDKPVLDYGDRVPLRAPITLKGNSLLRNVMIIEPTHYDSSFILESGRVDLLHLVGISDQEREYARVIGSAVLANKLEEVGFSPVTDPARGELNDA